MINEKEKLQLKLEIYNNILDCFPCPKINFLEPDNNPDINIFEFKENLSNMLKETRIQLNTYEKIEKEIENERYKRNKTNSRTNNKKGKV